MSHLSRIKLNSIAKAELVLRNSSSETLSGVRKRTNADIIVNFPIYTMATGKIESYTVINGKTISTGWSPYGIGFKNNGSGTDVKFSYSNYGSYPNFFGFYGLLIKDGVKINSNPQKDINGRTAIGLSSTELLIEVIPKHDKNACTTSKLADRMRSYGCIHAGNLDGSLSSQGYFPGWSYNSGRPVAGWLCIWLKDSKVSTNPKTEPAKVEVKIEEGTKTMANTTLKLNSKGSDVELLQILLNIVPDGSFGPATNAAVKAFQKANGLSVDGSVGPKTWAVLTSSKPKPTPTPVGASHTVCIDAGHSISTPGKCSPDRTYYEHEFNLDLSKRMDKILVRHGIKVFQTRKDILALASTENKCLDKRVQFANSIPRLNLLVSIHTNAATSKDGTGWSPAKGWTIYTSAPGDSAERNKAAKRILARAKEAGITLRDYPHMHEKYKMCAGPIAPAVLIEHGFHTNKSEVELLKSSSYRDKLAEANCKGILDYFGVKWIDLPKPAEVTNRSKVQVKFKLSEEEIIYLNKFSNAEGLYKKLLV